MLGTNYVHCLTHSYYSSSHRRVLHEVPSITVHLKTRVPHLRKTLFTFTLLVAIVFTFATHADHGQPEHFVRLMGDDFKSKYLIGFTDTEKLMYWEDYDQNMFHSLKNNDGILYVFLFYSSHFFMKAFLILCNFTEKLLHYISCRFIDLYRKVTNDLGTNKDHFHQ